MTAAVSLMLRHELRINWRVTSARTSSKLLIVALAGLVVVIHLAALALPFALAEMPPIPRIDLLTWLTSAGAFALVMMTSIALIGTVKLIYSRADLDLLLSSPVPAQAIVFTRVVAIALGNCAIGGLFVLPCANVLAAFGYPRFLLAYPVLLCLSLVATALGVLIAQGLFRLLGPARTRLLAQILAAVIGIGFMILMNLPNLLSDGSKTAALQTMSELAHHAPTADSWIWLPARAALGEPLPFLIGLLFCIGLFAAVVFGVADRLIANAIAAGGVAARSIKMRATRCALSPAAGPAAVMRRKEWLLIGRDPWLMTQIGQQLLTAVPCIFLLWKAGWAPGYMWLVVILLAGQLAGALTWLTMSTEEAPDLLATAPVRRRDVLAAKLTAALVPTAAIAAVPVMVALYMDAWLGFTILLCSAGSALSTSLLHMRYPSSAKRSDLAWRGNSNRLLSFVELGLGLTWVAFGALMLALRWWGMLPLAFVAPFLFRLVRAGEGRIADRPSAQLVS